MSVVNWALFLLAALTLLGEWRWLTGLHAALAQASGLQQRLHSLRVQHREFLTLEESKAQIALVQGVAEQLIDSTTEATHETHQKIADVPFSVLESIPATRDAAKAARGVHDLTSTGVYAAVSLANKGLGQGLRGLFKLGKTLENELEKELEKDLKKDLKKEPRDEQNTSATGPETKTSKPPKGKKR